MNDELLKLRGNIDRLDQEILDRLAERARSAQRIGEIKQGNLYRPEREAQVLRRLAESNPGPLPDHAVQRVFREIMSACLALEHPLRVAYLGPAGTFSESASRKHFGAAPTFLARATIDEVFRAVEAGVVDYGVVPVENSTEGAVGGTLDLLLAHSLQVCGEVRLRIHQNLLSRADGIGAAKRLYSHAQSLAQCHEWLNRNLANLPRVPVASNAEAARLASEDAESCAIAGEAAAELYGLNVLAANIEDDPNNTTRFLVIAHHDAGESGRDKTSLVCSAANRPGAMHALLEPFARHGVSMTKLQSRPAAGGLWEYVFYIDIEGHRADEGVAQALAELDQRAAFLKVLGSYPVAVI
ncbi:MAG TPA: prephenate dehydratase [Rhodocyclaceae bacterium]|nr:prephenate dehydratase [Rhodocyclaceae bacterium]